MATSASPISVPKDGTADGEILRVENLKMYFPITQGIILQRQVGWVRAVDDISFTVNKGETLGLVGESGCGKSPAGRAILQLYKPTGGTVNFLNKSLTTLGGGELRKMRREMQMIFQDPYASLNPRMTVGSIIGEPLEIHNLARGREKQERVQELLRIVGLNPYFAHRYRPRPGGPAELHRLRRAHLGPRRVDSGAGHQPARRAPRPVQSDLPVHCPRPLGGAPHQRSRGGHVRRQDRRANDARPAIRA